MSEDAETNANEAGAGPSGSGGTTNRRRISKACENCRVRRTKCSGSIPCSACTDNALEGSCYVREKARPNRWVFCIRGIAVFPEACSGKAPSRWKAWSAPIERG